MPSSPLLTPSPRTRCLSRPSASTRGIYNRLHIGPYRVIYYVDGDVVTIRRVDRVAEP